MKKWVEVGFPRRERKPPCGSRWYQEAEVRVD
jgi:hypothetical protein